MNSRLILYMGIILTLVLGVYAAESSMQASVQVISNEPFVKINSPSFGWQANAKPYFNVSFKEKVKYSYYSINNGKWNSFCSACSSYIKSISLPQGIVNLTVRAINNSNFNYTNSILLNVDSIAPKISSTSPASNAYANGDFGVYYTELNLKEVILKYGASSANLDKSVNFIDCLSGINKWCYNHIDLNEFNNKSIYYQFVVKDNSLQASSKLVLVKVDLTPPSIKINSPLNQSYINAKAQVYFNITSSELVTFQYSDNGLTYVSLSSGKNFFYGLKTFTLGQHNLTIRATDYAGNTVLERRSFEVSAS